MKKLIAQMQASAQKEPGRFWRSGSLLAGLFFALLFPLLTPLFALPYLIALSFTGGEMRSLASAALVGLLADLYSDLFPFGFFTIIYPALVAFFYSLEHFFNRTPALARLLTPLATLTLFFTMWLWSLLACDNSWLFLLTYAQSLLALIGASTLNFLTTWALSAVDKPAQNG